MTKLLDRPKMPRIGFWIAVVLTAVALFMWANTIWNGLDYRITVVYTYFVVTHWAFTFMDGQATYYHKLFHQAMDLAWKAHDRAEQLREELRRVRLEAKR